MAGLFGLFDRADNLSSDNTESTTESASGSALSNLAAQNAHSISPTSPASSSPSSSPTLYAANIIPSTSTTLTSPAVPAQSPPPIASTSITPSSSYQNQISPTTTSISTSKSSESPAIISQSALPFSPDHRLSNGIVAGIVIAVAIGFAIVASLITFFITRRRKDSKERVHHTQSEKSSAFESKSGKNKEQDSGPKVPFKTPISSAPAVSEKYIPQSADDATVKHNVNTIMDQIELHVENFYQNYPATSSTKYNTELGLFDSPYLVAPLASLLPKSKNKTNLIKHVLAQHVISSVSPTSDHAKSLLPQVFVLLPNTIRSAETGGKPGSAQLLSQWRVLTSYLRPDPSKDAAYLAERDQRIQNTVSGFSKAFAPWKRPEYSDVDRNRSLFAILEGAADLGVWMFGQPSTFEFYWPKHSEADRGRLAILPALLKTTDERGQGLREAQVIVNMVMKN